MHPFRGAAYLLAQQKSEVAQIRLFCPFVGKEHNQVRTVHPLQILFKLVGKLHIISHTSNAAFSASILEYLGADGFLDISFSPEVSFLLFASCYLSPYVQILRHNHIRTVLPGIFCNRTCNLFCQLPVQASGIIFIKAIGNPIYSNFYSNPPNGSASAILYKTQLVSVMPLYSMPLQLLAGTIGSSEISAPGRYR